MILASAISTVLDLATVIAGFSLIILIHELGHFLAARWAGIRVLAFALGFGPAIVSYRKGLGVRAGSSGEEYAAAVRAGTAGAMSPTEYRWNILPLGGYVKMLGQEDDNPGARSSEPDSYQNCKPWKRMIVISAGVVMNVLAAAVLFVVVFSVGLKTEPATIGQVLPGSPAATTLASNASELGVTEPGLRPGDRIVMMNGRPPDSFKDLSITVAMGARDEAVVLDVLRSGLPKNLRFEIVPKEDPQTRLLSIGVGPGQSLELEGDGGDAAVGAALRDIYARAGLQGVEPGSVLTRAGTISNPSSPAALLEAARTSNGAPIEIAFRSPSGTETTVALNPPHQTMLARVLMPDSTEAGLEHVAGLLPVMAIEKAHTPALAAGLKDGDVFAMLGTVEWPSLAAGIAEIRASKGKTIDVVVARTDTTGKLVLSERMKVPVSREGTIGFAPGTTMKTSAHVARWPTMTAAGGTTVTKLIGLDRLPAGATLLSVAGTRVQTLSEAWSLLRDKALVLDPGASRRVTLSFSRPIGPIDTPETLEVELTSELAQGLRSLAWESPVPMSLFAPEQFLLKSDSLAGALAMGIRETHRVMVQTYLTFARLFQGTVKVEHLKGPVGIAHVGTLIADRGIIWVLFFMAVISVNLAVINFLPLPIVDGGHFVFLLYEQFTGRPVSIVVQNIATLAGLVLIGSVFLVVTYNDLMNLLFR